MRVLKILGGCVSVHFAYSSGSQFGSPPRAISANHSRAIPRFVQLPASVPARRFHTAGECKYRFSTMGTSGPSPRPLSTTAVLQFAL